MSNRPTFGPAELEAVYLNAAIELLDSMLSAEVLRVCGRKPEQTVTFDTSVHSRLFNILLVDFLSRTQVKDGLVPSRPYLSALGEIADAPQLGSNTSAKGLQASVQAFQTWLEGKPSIPVDFATLGLTCSLPLRRVDYLKMCGDLAKHNSLRSVRVADRLCALLRDSGHLVALHDGVLATEDFFERFHRDVFVYQASVIAEFLSALRWDLHSYLKPVRDLASAGQPEGFFSYPATLSHPFAQASFWAAMNATTKGPYIARLGIAPILTQRY